MNFRKELQESLNKYRAKKDFQEGYVVIPDVVKQLNTRVVYLGVPLSDQDWKVYDTLLEWEVPYIGDTAVRSSYSREKIMEELGIEKEQDFLDSMSHLTSASLLIREDIYSPPPFLFYEKLTNHHLILEFSASTGTRPDFFKLDQTIKDRVRMQTEESQEKDTE